MKGYAIAIAALIAAACVASKDAKTNTPHSPTPPIKAWAAKAEGPAPQPGAHEKLRAPIARADGLDVIVSDVVIPPNGTVPRHTHPGEEFVYIIEGSAVHVEEGKPEQILQAGEATVIAPGAEHEPRGGEEGARAIIFRVHVDGEAERTLVE